MLVFIAALGLSLVVVSRGYGSLWQLLLLWSMGSRVHGIQYLSCVGSVAPRHAEPSQAKDQGCVPCVGRWILSHQATRGVHWVGSFCLSCSRCCTTTSVLHSFQWEVCFCSYLCSSAHDMSLFLWLLLSSFLYSSGFEQLGWYILAVFLSHFCIWNLLTVLNLWVYSLIKLQKFYCYFFKLFAPSIFKDSNYLYTSQFEIVLNVSNSWLSCF